MPLGIRPTVDFAFKKIFGSPQNSVALIGLLNAILDLDDPIVSVVVLNPFNYQEFADSKLIVLDVRCRDNAGRTLNVEMQVSVNEGLQERLVYYACSMYVEQLKLGDDYSLLKPAISICLLKRGLFDDLQPHHCFQMADLQSGRRLLRSIEVHTLELSKYHLTEETISSGTKLEQWAFLLLRAQEYDSAELRLLLPGLEFEQAIGTLEVISTKVEDRIMYDQRQKAQRDYDWAISGARKEGLKEGREEGREEVRDALIKTVFMLEELLGVTATAPEKRKTQPVDELLEEITRLQKQLRDRQI